MLFEALAIYLYLKSDGSASGTLRQTITCSMLLCIAVLMRPTAAVIVIAIVCLSILQAITKSSGRYLMTGVLMLVSYVVLYDMADMVFKLSGIAPYGIKTNNLWFKLVLGLTGQGVTHQATTDAEHTNLYYDLMRYGFDYDEYRQEAYNYIMNLLRTSSLDIDYISTKVAYFAGGVDNQYLYCGSSSLSGMSKLVSLLNAMGIILYSALLLFSGIRCAQKKIVERVEVSLPALSFLGYFLSYVLFETQTRYRYEQYYMLMLMAIPAMAWAWRILVQRLAVKSASGACLGQSNAGS